MKSKKIETFLPCFEGFYNTVYQFQDDNLLYTINQDREEKNLSPINYDSLKIDYKSYELDIVKSACDVIANELKNYVFSIDFQELISPKEYNFKNDSVNVSIQPNIKAIKAFIYENRECFEKFLKNRYTSYDGFMSHYENDFQSWENDTKNFTDFSIDGHRLGSILEFIALKIDINRECNLYYQIKENISEENYIENYQDLLKNPSCSECENLIENKEVLNTIEKFKKLQGENPKTCLCDVCLAKVYN